MPGNLITIMFLFIPTVTATIGKESASSSEVQGFSVT
jgi:hypothetical protein